LQNSIENYYTSYKGSTVSERMVEDTYRGSISMSESPEQLHVSFQEAFNRHDLDAIVALYEPDAVLASAEGPMQGMDAIREAYRGFLAMRPTIELQTLGMTGLAMLHGRWVLHGTGTDGGAINWQGRNTETARLQPDGR
jgi:ketosteroid isomerase-like protein